MSATKQTKELLQQVREQLDADSRAKVEPILRQVLDVAKPKKITEVAYRSAPEDQATIEALQATIAEKDDAIGKLKFKLASAQLRKNMPLNELLPALHKRGFAFHDCFLRCLDAARADERSRVEALKRALAAFQVNLGAYANILIPAGALEARKLNRIVGEATIATLKEIAEKVHAESGVSIDFKISFGKRPSQ